MILFRIQGLLEKQVRNLIFTSGTLSPLKEFISELDIPINITLENLHIVEDTHIFARVISQGEDGERFFGNYENR